MTMPKRQAPLIERFTNRIEVTQTCWFWTGSLNDLGYPKLSMSHNTSVYAHRVSHELFKGPIPDGLVIDHLCCVPACVNPDHLEAVTQQENLRRGHERRGTARAFKAHGTRERYTGGCICDDCRAANATHQRERRKAIG
jgi:hypothetical protein